MKFSKSLAVLGAMASMASAQPVNNHLHERAEDIVTVHIFETVTVDGPAPTDHIIALAGPPSAAPSPSAAPAPAPAPAPAAAPAPSHESSPAPSPSPSHESSGSSTGLHTGAGSAGAFGITYSPYQNNGWCKSADEVKSDLVRLSGYPVIRIYGTDCNQVANVKAALAPGQKMFVGIYDVSNIANDVNTIVSAVDGDWATVHTISVGNELVNSGQATPDQVGAFVAQARAALANTGYTGPIVAVDTFIAVINNPSLCQYSDYMGVNAHAFFDTYCEASGAGEWALQQIQRVWAACDGTKSVLITESGWPTRGDSNGKAVPSVPNQEAAIASLKSTIGNDCILFTAYNDLWKNPGYLNVEQYWGIYN